MYIQWLRWVFEFVGSHFCHPMSILLLPYAPSPFCRILDSNSKIYHLMAICTTKFFVARIYYEYYLLFFYKSELEIHLVPQQTQQIFGKRTKYTFESQNLWVPKPTTQNFVGSQEPTEPTPTEPLLLEKHFENLKKRLCNIIFS